MKYVTARLPVTLIISALLVFMTAIIALPAWAQQSAPEEIQILIDKTAPPTPIITLDHEGWTNQDVTVNFSNVQDNAGGAGVECLSYSTDGGTTRRQMPGDGNTTIFDEGIHSIQAETHDKVGHIGPMSTDTAKIDKTPPVINITGITDGQTYYEVVTPGYTITDTGGSELATQNAFMEKDGQNYEWANGNNISGHGAYVLAVTAADNAGNTKTATVQFNIAAPEKPAQPVVAATGNSAINISWSSVNGAAGYRVYRDGSADAAFDGSATAYEDNGLNTNTMHSYTVEAYNDIGASPLSEPASAWTLAAQPTNLRLVSATSTNITVAWDKADNPAGTLFFAEISGNGHSDSVGYAADLETASFGSLLPGKEYVVTVKAKNGAEVETAPVSLNVFSNTPPCVTIATPAAGAAFSEVGGYGTITVSGTVTDLDDDNCTVTATIGGVSKNQVVENCAGGKPFSIVFDVAEDNISEGVQTVVVLADDGK